MAEPALAYLPDPAPCAALDAILAEDEHTLPERTAFHWLTVVSNRGRSPIRGTRCASTCGIGTTTSP
ncbi:MAG: hypothetical protein OXG44_06985 [Gammaproteobacteria bacterium]|nr:hypothetical protein [Gammaproteobacteria bacterium]